MRKLFLILLFSHSLSAVSLFDLQPEEARELINKNCMAIEAETPQVGTIENRVLALDTPIRIYKPENEDSHSLVLFIHGGAWVAGNLDTHDHLARYLCRNSGSIVVSVGYQNSPEGKFPFPLEQCFRALQWSAWHFQPRSIALVGDSAGGNMCAALSMMSRDRLGPKIDAQILINPAPDLSCQGVFTPLGDWRDALRWQALIYLESVQQATHPYASPLLAEDLSNLPPTLIIVSELDDLREDGERYAEKLRAAGIKTNVYYQWNARHLAGHGARASNHAQESLNVAVAALKALRG